MGTQSSSEERQMISGEVKKTNLDMEFPMGSKYKDIMEAIMTENKETGKKHLFRDSEFPTNYSSLSFVEGTTAYEKISTWKRCHTLSGNPEFYSKYLIQKIFIGEFTGWHSWLAALAALSTNPALLVKAVNKRKQSMRGENFVGMFAFRIWTLGTWNDVIIDDYLPMIGNNLAFMKCDKKDPYWLHLLQKAFAKHCGSYQRAQGGRMSEFFEDFTGGLSITYKLGEKAGEDVFRVIEKVRKSHGFICCSKKEKRKNDGNWTEFISKHGYQVRDAIRVKYEGSSVRLIQLMTPHQREPEWTGSWSVGSRELNEAGHDILSRMRYERFFESGKLVTQLCGVFWMNFEDFKEYFTDVTVLATGEKFEEESGSNFSGGKDNFIHYDVEGIWKAGSEFDGEPEDEDVFAKNPQYYMKLDKHDKFIVGYDDPSYNNKCFLLMELMQRDYERAPKEKAEDEPYLLLIDINIYKVHEKPKSRLSADFFRNNKDVANSKTHCGARQVSISTDLDPGQYIVVPSIYYDAKEDSPYLLRVYSEQEIKLKLL